MKETYGKRSIILSACFIALCFGALTLELCWLPGIVDTVICIADQLGDPEHIGSVVRTLILTDAYLISAVAFAAIALLSLLLCVVWQGKVFTRTAVRLLKGLSWCCFLETLLFGLLTMQFIIAIFVALCAALLGLLLRVVTHVIEEGTRIKSENDYTI